MLCPLCFLAIAKGFFHHDGSWGKLRMDLASAGDGVTFGCRSLVEDFPMMILRSELLIDYVPPPQTGGLTSIKLLL
jgi:hypothetical protein